jgi:paraquat-inducible protein B
MQQSLTSLSQAAVQLEQLVSQLNTDVAPALGAALVQAKKTLDMAENTLTTVEGTLKTTGKTIETAEKTLSPNSSLQQEARVMLKELGAAARSLRVLTDYLARHPEALIRGK